LGYGAQWAHFRDLRHAHPETFGQLNASREQHLLRRLDKAFAAFFRRLKAGDKPGFPRFKSRRRFKSLEYTYGDGCKLRQDEHGRMRFYVQKVGELRLCYHRGIPKGAILKHVVIKQTNPRWYACLMLELPSESPARVPSGKQVGLDVGLKSLAALSSDERVAHPHWLRARLPRLRRLQRHAARQVKGSRRQGETYRQMARLHEPVANQRTDGLHQLSHRLVCAYDRIAIEDLALAFMNRNRHLSQSSYDAGLGRFRQMLEYKAERAGIAVIAVDPDKTTQACSGEKCENMVPKDLSVRMHVCPVCGLVLDRDVNLARIILSRAKRSGGAAVSQDPPGRGGQPETWAVAPGVG